MPAGHVVLTHGLKPISQQKFYLVLVSKIELLISKNILMEHCRFSEFIFLLPDCRQASEVNRRSILCNHRKAKRQLVIYP